jgi:hypothetical protein
MRSAFLQIVVCNRVVSTITAKGDSLLFSIDVESVVGVRLGEFRLMGLCNSWSIFLMIELAVEAAVVDVVVVVIVVVVQVLLVICFVLLVVGISLLRILSCTVVRTVRVVVGDIVVVVEGWGPTSPSPVEVFSSSI